MFELLFIFELERDVNNEVLWVWSYPGVDGGVRDLLMKKCSLDQNEDDSSKEEEALVPPFSFGHTSRVWYYLSNFQAAEAETLPKVWYPPPPVPILAGVSKIMLIHCLVFFHLVCFVELLTRAHLSIA